ncbi:hypothetical protein CJF30_00006924 [Rutstroemia sp. NJR-2017a BBW]|nr:hypothetical protein CJF30_00006924 [Rutstroemia sp. NJR-2017a BBW]
MLNLPLNEWYLEKTSEWTLDYPPFFAYFELFLSKFAEWVDPLMLRVDNLEYDSWQTVYFQRASVIATELVLVYALHLELWLNLSSFVKSAPANLKRPSQAAALSILLSPGLLIIDHIHFQYNGFMYGLLILSLVMARNDGTKLASGILFAALLCLKHIYLYLAPAYFVFLLSGYCLGPKFGPKRPFDIKFWNAIKLGVSIAAVFGAAFGPFVYFGQMPQLLERLFPFGRGLCHAYWAPNIWALYSFADRVLIAVAPKLGLHVDKAAINSVTRGLVGNTSFAVLPEITKGMTFALTAIFDFVPLLKVYQRPTWDNFIGGVTLCAYSSFLFSWHVHEKAILLVIIPFSLIALKDRRYLSAFRPLAVAGHLQSFQSRLYIQSFGLYSSSSPSIALRQLRTKQGSSYLIDLPPQYTIDLVLFLGTSNRLWKDVGIPSIDVHKLLLCNWGGRKLGGIFGYILYELASDQ